MFQMVTLTLQVSVVCLLLRQLVAQNSLSKSADLLSSYETLAQGVHYDINFTITSSPITAGSYTAIDFNNRFEIEPGTLTDCKASANEAVAATTAPCSVSFTGFTYRVKIEGMFPITQNYEFLRVSFRINNPYGEESEKITTYIYDSANNQLVYGDAYIPYTASTMANCSISSASELTSTPTTQTFSFTPVRKIMQNSFLLITMPKWDDTTSNKDSNTLNCTGIAGSDGSVSCGFDTVNSEEIINVTGFVTATRTTLESIQIQIETLKNPYSLKPFGPISFELMVDSVLSQTCQNNYHTVTQPNVFNVLQLGLSNLSISSINSDVRLVYTSSKTLPSSNRLQLTYPDELTVVYSGMFSIYSNDLTQLTLSDVNAIFVRGFTVTTPPSTRPFAVTITTYEVSAGVGYKMNEGTLQFQNEPGVLTSPSVSADVYFVNQFTRYTLTFSLAHQLITGSFINVVFPPDLLITMNSSCSSGAHTCAVFSPSNVTLTLTSPLSEQSTVTVVVTQVRNANEAKTTDSFTIYTYYDSLYDSLVDNLASGLTVTMVAQTLANAAVVPSSHVTYELTEYAIDFQLVDPIPAGGSIVIVFPSTVSPEGSTLTAASFNLNNCAVSEPTTNRVQINDCFATEMDVLTVSLTLDKVRNPPSLKPTDSFVIQSRGQSSRINYIDSGVTVVMQFATNLTSFTITPASDVVSDQTVYDLQIEHSIDVHESGDYFILEFPSLMSVPAAPVCTPTGVSVDCQRLSANNVKATYTSDPLQSIAIDLTDVTNYLIGDQAVSFTITVYNSQNYGMQKYQNYMITYSESTLTSVQVNHDDNIALGEASNVTLTVNNDFSLYSSLDVALTQLDIAIPATFGIGSSCSSSSGSCSPVPAEGLYQVSNVGFSLTNFNVTMLGITLNYFDPSSDTFQLTYSYNGFNVSVKDDGVVVSRFCMTPCQRCDEVATACESCLPAPNTLIYYDPALLRCSSSCTDGTYPDTVNECQPCIPPCRYCLDFENCTQCVNDTWLHESRCLTVCPDTHYNDSSGSCLICQAPCATCTTLIDCSSCSTNYYSNLRCVTADMCPTGTYANSTNMVCEDCEFPCLTCNLNQTDCTSCEPGYLFYDNNCVQTCPDEMYPNSVYCFDCVSPCANCSNASYCESCVTDYLYQGECFAAEDCPSTTYPNATQMKCKTCPIGCTACTNLTHCSGCTAAYLFYDNRCLTDCPDGTFKVGTTCLNCSSPCQTCVDSATKCLSCTSDLYYNHTCLPSCPGGTFEEVGQCSNCQSICNTCSDASTCDSCTSGRYLEGTACVTDCSNGHFGDAATNTCEACLSPCSECEADALRCTKCIAPQLEYLNTCINTQCPAPYYQVDGSCRTCPNCMSCLDANTCLQCNPSLYEYNGVCYSSCPENAHIPDEQTNTCGTCADTCFSCQGLAKNCTACFSGTFLWQGSCLQECPLGFIQDLVTGTCLQPLIGSVIYFPFFLTFLFCGVVTMVSKCLYSSTETVTALAATVSLCEMWSWILLAYILTVDYTLSRSLLEIGMTIGFSLAGCSIVLGVIYSILFCKSYQSDRGWKAWKNFEPSHLNSYRTVTVFSTFSFRFFRFIYSRLFNRNFLSMYIADSGRFLSTVVRLTVVSLLGMTLPMMILCGVVLYQKQIYDQTFFCCLDTLSLGFLAAVFLTTDSFNKGEDFFEQLQGSSPFLKYKNMASDESMIGELLSRPQTQQSRGRAQSEVGDKEKERIFRGITFVDNNKFGHLNVLEEADKSEVQSQPEYNKLGDYEQYDPNASVEDRVVDDLFFLEQPKSGKLQESQQEQAIREREKEKEAIRLKEEEEAIRLKEEEAIKAKEQEEAIRREQEEKLRIQQEEDQRRKRQMQEQDEQERVDLELPDLVAIDRAEKSRRSPLDLLSNKKTMQDRPISDKALKKLQELSNKNGIDPEFMKGTFGIEKNHNPELLNQIIDKHHHVKRQSINDLFNDKNDPEVLQELFGKHSSMDPAKLRALLNEPNSSVLIANLAGKETGRLSPQMAKQLLDKKSNYSKDFAVNLLGDGEDMNPQKLQGLLKTCDRKGTDSPLKALKKVGGDNLSNKDPLGNMLGTDSKLDTDNFTRVANELPKGAIDNVFGKKGKLCDTISSKVLNNKKINLKHLTPILEDEELVHELGEALADGEPNLQDNLLDMFKNAEDIDYRKLEQLLNDPVLREKFLNEKVDPEFLNHLLSKDENTDMELFSKTIGHMEADDVAETFKFDPERNIDFGGVAKLFETNPKSDPLLISKILQPGLAKDLFYKGNNTKMFNKLVEKGSEFDPEVIRNVYGHQNHSFFDTKTDNGFERDRNNGHPRNQKDYSLGFEKNPASMAKMSQTAGGMLSFLSPTNPKEDQLAFDHDKGGRDEEEDGRQAEEIDDGEIKDDDLQLEIEGGRRRKPRLKKLKKKPVPDIRLAAQQIYLQRIEAPHEHAMKKTSIRKKRKKKAVQGVMDEDNDIFDLDF